MTNLVRHRLFWPTVVLVVLLVSNLIFSDNFFRITLQDGHLYGSLIDILRRSAPLVLVALGMTLVISTGGIDLSVGSVMAISGALACLLIGDLSNPDAVGPVLLVIGAAIALCLVFGLWNGFLVAVLGIQPIIATLILMVAGRGVAQLITDGQILNVHSAPYRVIGAGYFLGVPVSFLIAAVAVGLTVALTRRTALGLLLESVGGSPTASRLAGIRARRITIMVYVFAAAFAGVAGLIYSSDVSSADSNAAGNLIELNAILAVVLGGTALTGGRFSIAGSVLGAVIITTLDITAVSVGVPVETTLLFKAVVVIILCLAQSATFRAKVFGRFGSGSRSGSPRAEVAA
ncbi:ABC transporter permease [Actinoplanes sp. Pm04-4]|uniref:ABC transporter permease n=1 Tax=Paractinoplanes pyxinae TaxID=2997416 RepID=A0ABT4AYU1_9ACTN|nr:ABC transporter permease [Actinoplanes pyxinae]MCY1139413.1 ABC transporter permease [Actinoplanes pyxinae]